MCCTTRPVDIDCRFAAVSCGWNICFGIFEVPSSKTQTCVLCDMSGELVKVRDNIPNTKATGKSLTSGGTVYDKEGSYERRQHNEGKRFGP